MPRDFTHEKLVSWLRYEPSTGLFVWLKNRKGVKAGDIAGGDDGRGYMRVKFCGRNHGAHRLAWFYVHKSWPLGQIDHLNADRADNRIANLRDVTAQVNVENRRKANGNKAITSPLGVTWHAQCGKWQASIKSHGRNHYLGLYEDSELAHQAYVAAKRRLHEGCTI